MSEKKVFWIRFTVIAVFILVLIIGCSNCNKTKKYDPIDLTQWDAELLEFISGMTTSEKIGQTIQTSLMNISQHYNLVFNYDDVTTHLLGSVFTNGGWRPETGEGDWNSLAGPSDWVDTVNKFQAAAAATRLKIPLLYGIDAVHGHNGLVDATIFPHNSGMGAIAAGDLHQGIEAARTAGRITAKEMRATGMNWNFGPQATVAHDVRWGRAYESFGENAEMVAAMTKAIIQGLQANGVAACAKHYIGEGWNLYGLNGTYGYAGTESAPLTPEQLADALLPYRAAIDAGVFTIMPALSSTNGIRMHRNKDLLTDLLKGELGFQGFIISDWNGSGTNEDLRDSFNAGVDMHMNGDQAPGNYAANIRAMEDYVARGEVSMERLDDAVLRILRVKKAMGLLKPHYNPTAIAGQIGTPASRMDARRIAAKAITLMKNDDQAIQKLQTAANILVTGQAADNVGMQCGGWTFNWRGGTSIPTTGTTIVAGIRNAIGEDRVTLANAGDNASATNAITGNYDAIIAVIGDSPHAEDIGDRGANNGAYIPIRDGSGANDVEGSAALNAGGDWNDAGMLDAVYAYKAANPDVPVIVIMLTGRPMTITSHLAYWDAFVVGWLPGSETGDAIADVLFGHKDFVGRTPYTWRSSYVTNPGSANAGTYPESSEIIYPYGYGLTKAGMRNGE
ncbi:MAG: glycoside hydrolase family 3 C-terminal domain-containing protein [Treponema sp.]|nr:glycoside hydrolase family 3 C-terminal domain-containing protein [Treponema sp.]